MWTHDTASEPQTAALGAALAQALPETLVVALNGTLGAGKTRLVQALSIALGVAPGSVLSPTFVLMQPHRGQRQLYHFDAYRIADDDEFLNLGVDEIFAGPGVSLVEWAERVSRCLPRDHLTIQIEVTGQNSRRFHFAAHGPNSQATLERLQKSLI